jgi:protein required for attachment to host cells
MAGLTGNPAGAFEADRANGLWLMTADSRGARLFHGVSTPHGRLHLTQRSELVEVWDEKEHHRASIQKAPHGQRYATGSHEEEERIHRFARQVARWLERQLAAGDIRRVHAFCAKRLLGPLRGELPERLQPRVVDHALDLAQLTAGELESHAAVQAAEREERALLAGDSGARKPR